MSEHRLPEIEQTPTAGTRLVQRAIALTLVAVGAVAALAVAALYTVRLDVTVDAAGVLEPARLWPVRSAAAGIVEAVLVTSGESVVRGQLLLRLDALRLEQALDGLRLEERFKRSSPHTARTELALLRQRIGAAESELARRRVTAPGDGVVLTEELERMPGAWVEEGALLLEVAAPAAWRALLLVPERDIHTIRIGDPVRVEVPAATAPGDWLARYPATVAFVGADPAPGEAAPGRYRVHAELDAAAAGADALARLKRGMTVRATVITRSARAIDLLLRYLGRRVGPAAAGR